MRKIKFKDIPLFCNYAAIDSEGRLKAFDEKPIKTATGWERVTGRFECSSPFERFKGDWENSLVKNTVKFDKLNERQKFLLKYYDLAFNLIAKFFEYEDIDEHLDGLDIDYFYEALTKDYNTLTSKDIPSGYNYAAVNRFGEAYAYKTRPFVEWHFWEEDTDVDDDDGFIGNFNSFNWQYSLVSNITDDEKTS